MNVAIRTKNTTITGGWSKLHIAVGTPVKNKAIIGRNFQFLPKPTDGTCEMGIVNDVTIHFYILWTFGLA